MVGAGTLWFCLFRSTYKSNFRVPNNCGTPNMYLQLFRCKVTGANANASAIAPAKPPAWCEDNLSACTKGAKQMVIWHQAERNNIDTNTSTGIAGEQDDHQQKSPGYNLKLGFKNGEQRKDVA